MIVRNENKSLNEKYAGKTIKRIEFADAHGYEPTKLLIEFDDDTPAVYVMASTVMYDQYSSSPYLYLIDATD